jgi:hypothetical protein
MTDQENEDTFDNEIEEQEPHQGFEEDAVTRELNETFEKIQERNSKEYEESLDLEENDDKVALNEETDTTLLNTDEDSTAEAVEAPTDDFPATWKGDLKEEWKAASPALKAEVQRREGDFMKGIEQYRQYANYANDVAETFKPYDAAITAAGMNQKQVLGAALNTMYRLKTGSPQEKASELLNLASTYGVTLDDVTTTNELNMAGMPLVDPEVEQLKAENAQILSFLQHSNQEKQQQQIGVYASELDKFEADPANKYFADVREEMAQIFGNSQEELSLQDVYDNAVWANPVTREKLIVERQATERRDAAEKAADAKRTAKTNVASKGQLPVNAKANGTLEGEIDDVWAAIKARR